MTVEILGADNQCYSFDIGELSEINRVDMWAYDGCECFTVNYKNGETIMYSDDTIHGHCDGGYLVYDSATGFNLFACEVWINSTSAYNRMI